MHHTPPLNNSYVPHPPDKLLVGITLMKYTAEVNDRLILNVDKMLDEELHSKNKNTVLRKFDS